MTEYLEVVELTADLEDENGELLVRLLELEERCRVYQRSLIKSRHEIAKLKKRRYAPAQNIEAEPGTVLQEESGPAELEDVSDGNED